MEMDIAFGPPPVRLPTWREAVFVVLVSVSALLAISSVTLFAQAGAAAAAGADADRWIAPITMAVTNLLGSIFAFLTAREIRRDDADKKMLKSENLLLVQRISNAEANVAECNKDRAELRDMIDEAARRNNERFGKLWREVHGDDGEPLDDRRAEPDPDYKGPKRRKADKGSKIHKLPPQEKPPEGEPK